jgi:hypothetical protein
MSHPHLTITAAPSPSDYGMPAERQNRPQALRPEIARVIEALARAAARRDYRLAMEAALRSKAESGARR